MGHNSWTIQLIDNNGHSDTASLRITVKPEKFPKRVQNSIRIKRDSTGALHLHYRRHRNHDLHYICDTTDSLNSSNWNALDSSEYTEIISNAPPTDESVNIQLTTPPQNQKRAFFRLRLEVVDP
jgi:hypothetical protein